MIEVTQAGPLNTVQDLGRPGHRDIGVSAAGAMDPLAVRLGNILVGNGEGAAVIEVQTFPFALGFTRRCAFAVTGADAGARLDGMSVLPWSCRIAEAGQALELRQPAVLARTYVAFGGGLEVPLVMGSRSTSLRGGFGGKDGRPLAAGDKLPVADGGAIPWTQASGIAVVEPLATLRDAFPEPVEGILPLRALPAGEHDLFEGDIETFWNETWTISSRSDRTGYRLSGTPLKPAVPMEMRSHGVVPGVVQVPPSGEPIVQMSDANTAGGYPKIAGVIEGDLWRLGQARPGTRLKFVQSSHAEARAVERAIEGYVEDVRRTVPMVRRALQAMA